MFSKLLTYFKKLDWILLMAVVLLLSFGLAELYSIALSQNNPDLLNFKKQVLFVVVGLLALFISAFFDYFSLRSFNNFLYILGLVSLIGVLLFGSINNGTKGWFYWGGFTIQPVEFVKIVLLIFLARYFASISVKFSPFKHLFISGVGTLILVFLVMKQPDFGSAMVLLLLWLAMVMFAGIDKKYLIAIVITFLLAGSCGWFFYFKPYQKERILTFINPAASSLNQGYNITQAMIAVGSGRLTGRGIGFGSQSQLKFLPESQNDFIFAVIAEELGFAGVLLVVGFFLVIFYRLLKAARETNNDFAVYLLLGIMALLFLEMFINIGMNIGLLPVVGIALPFLSYGGSSIVSSLMMIGIAESIIIRSKIKY
jgi:rod shape determining protein RodA